MNKILIFLSSLVLSTNLLGDWYFNASLGNAGTAFDGHGDTAYSLGVGKELLSLMGNRVDVIAGGTYTKDEEFYNVGLQVERNITGPISAYVQVGGQYQALKGKRSEQTCEFFRGSFFVYGECNDVRRDVSDTDTSYFAGVGVASQVDDQLDLILQAVWQDVDSDFDKANNDSIITGGLRFWF